MRPWDRIERELEELRRIFGFPRRKPACDIIEREREIVILVDLPGFSKDEIDVEIGENYVKIRAEEKEQKEERYVVKERMRNFYRYIELPYKIKNEEAKAKLKNGVLEIILPKEEKVGKKIKVE